jgi:hypothetical protein
LQDASAKKRGEGAEEQEVRDGAQRVLVLAKEGLDMMEQVSGVLDGTIHSAEEWCQRLGKTDGEKQASEKAQIASTVPETMPSAPIAL